ncbi:MAG: thiamine phosphate synthase [Nitrospirae bacterium]|nr:thiamine phosphate synthase [Nitrospirota bacterium]
MNPVKGIYLILDQQYAKRPILSIAEEAVEAGVDVIQYREKVLSRRDALKIAERLRDLTARSNIPFIINDDPALALAVDADGVHLGQEDIPVHIARRILGKDRIIGLSTHSHKEAVEAAALDINYIGFGPIFKSGTKMAAEPLGPEAISRTRSDISIQMIAIGGINDENIAEVMRCGADGAAIISAILSSHDIKQSVRKLKERVRDIQRI